MAIKRVGIELEGAWEHRPAGFTHDGSVGGFVDLPYGAVTGECPSPPMQPTQVAAWLEANYPDKVNGTCGMHVHVSFDSVLDYSTLMSHAERVEAALLAALRTWGTAANIGSSHSLWHRLDGHNSFCRPGCDPDTQARARNKDQARYRILNFCHTLHGTLEVRVLPMFHRSAIAYKAIAVVLETIDALVATLPKPQVATVPTSLGPILCRVWKQGYRLTLQTSPAVRRQAARILYPHGTRGFYPDEYSRMLAYRLLTTDYVCEAVASVKGLTAMIAAIEQEFSALQVSVAVRATEQPLTPEQRAEAYRHVDPLAQHAPRPATS